MFIVCINVIVKLVGSDSFMGSEQLL